MRATMEYLRGFTTPDLLKMSNEDIVVQYQNDPRANSAPYTASLYIKLAGYIHMLRKKYPLLDSETCDSAALEAIEVVLNTFDASKSTKVATRFYSIYKRVLYREFRPFMYKKRDFHVTQTMESLDADTSNVQYDMYNYNKCRELLCDVDSKVRLYEMCPSDCKVILRYILNGYNAKEISRFEDIPYSTVRSKINKLKKVFPKSALIDG